MKKQKTRGRRGGRTPGHWRDGLTGQAVLDWRKQHKVSRAALAKALGVSPTSVQNWEIADGVPVPRSQIALRAIMTKGPGAISGNSAHGSKAMEALAASAGSSMIEGMKIEALGMIVAAMIGHAKPGTQLDVDSMVTRARNAIG
jgi:DNA-binding transcriptional regulator YiaG